jgi:hypothetical protein
VALNFPGAATPRELTSNEIEDIIERFATTAAVCETVCRFTVPTDIWSRSSCRRCRTSATTTDAADVILAGRAETLTAHQVRAGMRGVLGRLIDIKSFDGLLELSWHTDQLHRLGAGLGPDLDRGRIATTLAMLRRNGTTSFGRKRGL